MDADLTVVETRESSQTGRQQHVVTGMLVQAANEVLSMAEKQLRQVWVRSQCERLINQVVRHGGRRARAFGLQSAQLQAHVIAMRCNLALFAKQMLSAQLRAVLENAA